MTRDPQLRQQTDEWIVAITGASGIRYALSLIEQAAPQLSRVHVVVSDAALRVLAEEEGIHVSRANLSSEALFKEAPQNLQFHSIKNIGSRIASGTSKIKGMVICPCSMGTLGAISHGYSSNLIHRAAEVTLKERRPLLIVPRETPLSTIHLENMLRLQQAGAQMIPAMPGFYHNPKSIDDLVNLMVLKILDQMGLDSDAAPRWDGHAPGEEA